jgi:hypothetical protein
MKRLRNHYAQPLKFFACGEYGPQTERPHYHAILFGTDTTDHKTHFHNGTHQVIDGPTLTAWGQGFVTLGALTDQRLKYVTKYIQKKLYGQSAEDDPRQQPFSLMSKKLGANWALQNRDYLTDKLGCTIHGIEMGLPRYYAKILGIEDHNIWEEKQKTYKDSEHYHRALQQKAATLQKLQNLKSKEKL